jgi:multiple sugar transport system permease protein
MFRPIGFPNGPELPARSFDSAEYGSAQDGSEMTVKEAPIPSTPSRRPAVPARPGLYPSTPASTPALRIDVKRILRHLVLSVIGITMLLPFFWMVLASFKDRASVESLNPFPASHQWHADNYPIVLGIKPDPGTGKILPIDFKLWYFNSVFIAAWVTLLQVITSAMAAFAFARLKWPGRDRVFLLYLATMMIPGVVTMIPNFALMVKTHLFNSYLGLILPGAFSTFGTFLLRQFMLGIPSSLDEAATIDGATNSQLFWDIILPLSRPGIITLAIFTFMGTFGSFMWPLILIKSDYLKTLPVGMLFFDGLYDKQTNLMMAGTVMNMIPLIILFVTCQKFLVKGIQLGAVKG